MSGVVDQSVALSHQNCFTRVKNVNDNPHKNTLDREDYNTSSTLSQGIAQQDSSYDEIAATVEMITQRSKKKCCDFGTDTRTAPLKILPVA